MKKKEYLYYNEDDYELYKGKMQDVLKTFEANSVDSIVCDPPYELNFMGKGWDNSGVAFQPDTWKHCFDVLKEGGYLLAFGGSRTFHRIACAIEDAGFEIRDTIMWLYGSGFPKSMNIGLAIDKKNGVESKVVGIKEHCKKDFKENNLYAQDVANRNNTKCFGYGTEIVREAQNEWQGWGTALKPAYEPVIVARKPFKGSLVDNVMKNGVGGINIDECRVTLNGEKVPKGSGNICNSGIEQKWGFKGNGGNETSELGRFPANVILTYDETDFDEVCGGMPDTKSNGGKTSMPKMNSQSDGINIYNFGKKNADRIETGYIAPADEGSASRYFYCAKASKKDRDEGLDLFETKTKVFNGKSNNSSEDMKDVEKRFTTEGKNIHPTVKPVELMQYLVRLVTPKGGTIMDCFMGSGSTGKAVMFENRERNANYKFIGVEMTEEYLPICHSRIDYAKNKYEYDLEREIEEIKKEKEEQGYISLFDL